MAESKNSFIRSKMNKDLDERLIPNNEYRDGQNIAVSRSEDSDVGSLEAVLGNNNVFSITNLKCIGSLADETNGYIYYMVTDFPTPTQVDNAIPLADTTNICQICRYSPSSNQNIILVGGSTTGDGKFLNFSTNSPIHGINLVEDLLFWTDNRNQPRKINVITAAANSGANGYYQTEQSISVCKYAPFIPPAVIDLRSVAVGNKPSTMTDAADLSYVTIGIQQWASENLNVSKYRDGSDILFCDDATAWTAANVGEIGAWCWYGFDMANGVTYGKLYNKYAVNDSSQLAPYGHTLPTSGTGVTGFETLISSSASASDAQTLKSINLWDGDVGTDTFGFDGLPAGKISNVGVSSNVTTETTYWTSDTNNYLTLPDTNSTGVVVTTGGSAAADLGVGRSVRVLRDDGYKGWGGDPEFLKEKFVRFSYRFKYDDNEYSLIAPFTQECFIPQQDGRFLGDDENAAFRTTLVEFMQNEINNIVLNIELPSLNIINDFKVKEIDIIYKESDSLTYKILQTIPINPTFITNLNNTNIYQYTYQSTIPYKTLPSDETTRVYDKVPIKALGQEVAGNRVMYSNFSQSYSQPPGLDYYVGSDTKSLQNTVEYPEHSLKQNRNYQVGIILADKWGRQSDVILSSKDNILIDTGEPSEGSNFFSTYKPQGFYPNVKTWGGEELKVTFDSIVTGAATGDLYANPTFYTVTYPMSGPAWPSFLNWSTQELTTVANQAAYTFTNLYYPATTVFSLYLNQGLGWVLVDPVNYTTSNSGSDEIVVTYTNIIVSSLMASVTTNTTDATNDTYPNATWSTDGDGEELIIDVVVSGNAVITITVVDGGYGFALTDTITIPKTLIGGTTDVIITLASHELGGPTTAGWKLLAKDLYNTTQYKYEINYLGLDADPAVSIANTTAMFGAGRYLRGKYDDYVKIQTLTQNGVLDKFVIYTNEEIADNYMWQGDSAIPSNPTTRTEPLATDNINNATYSLNQMGWYSYRVVIKQQEQEYYNVYLPGIINGYPLNSDTRELDETAFCVLVHDNINKVPRDLSDVAAQDTQFNSNVLWFGRVTNNAHATYKNQQTVPTTNPDSVTLLSTVTNLFRTQLEGDSEYQAATDVPTPYSAANDEINKFCILDSSQRPVMAKIATQKAIGVTENNWTTGDPYPNAMGLAVYETKPTFTFLELFYETSNSDLISDLNVSINSTGDSINGLTDPTFVMFESYCTGSTVTTTFFPTTPNGIDLTTTALDGDMEVFQYNSDDTTVNWDGPDRSGNFTLVPDGAGGYTIEVQTPAAALLNYEYIEHYYFRITFTQGGVNQGVQSTQGFDGRLQNTQPNALVGLLPNLKVTETIILDYTSTYSFLGTNPGYIKGDNGSCNDCSSTSDLDWVIESVTIADINGGEAINGTNTGGDAGADDIDYYFAIQGQQVQGDCTNTPADNYWACRLVRQTDTYNVWNPVLHTLEIRLYDANGTGDFDSVTVAFTPQDVRYDGQVVYSSYPALVAPEVMTDRAGVAFPTQSDYYQTDNLTALYPSCGSGTLQRPWFVGEIQNWRDEDIYLYLYTQTTTTSGASVIRTYVAGNNSDPSVTTGPACGDGTVNDYSTNTWTDNNAEYDLPNPIAQFSGFATLKAFNPTPTQVNDGVRPGYPGFEDCVLVNFKAYTDLNVCGEGSGVYVVYCNLGHACPTYTNVSSISLTQPPLIGNEFPWLGPWPA